MKNILIVLCCSCFCFINSQHNFTTLGSTVNFDSYELDYSFGQVFIETSVSKTNFSMEGIHQVFPLSQTYFFNDVKILYYPNPTRDYVYLSFENFNKFNLEFTVFDTKGSVLDTGMFFSNPGKINLGKYSDGIYFIKITYLNNTIKSFKIILKR